MAGAGGQDGSSMSRGCPGAGAAPSASEAGVMLREAGGTPPQQRRGNGFVRH